MKVLLAVDGDDRYRDVVRAVDWCLALGADDEVFVTHVVATLRWMPFRSADEPGWAGVEREIFERVDAFVEDTVSAIASQGIPATALRLEGDVAEELVRAAGERGAAVIGLGALGQARSQDFLVGSVAEKVQSLATRDVLLVRPAGDDAAIGFRALIAVDGSPASLQAVDAFALRTRAERAEIRLVHVLEIPPASWEVGLASSEHGSSSVPPALRARADDAIRGGLERLDRHGLTADSVVRRGRAAAEILEEGESFGASLIVLGSRGHGRGERLVRSWNGTITKRVSRHAKCSVFVAASHLAAEEGGEHP